MLFKYVSTQAAAADDWLPLHFAAQNGHEQVAQAPNRQKHMSFFWKVLGQALNIKR